MRHRVLRRLLVFVLLTGSFPSHAQGQVNNMPAERSSVENPPTPTIPDPRDLDVSEVLAGPVDPASYRLGPGDVLSFELSGRVDRQTQLRVDAEGRLNVPEIGVLAVGGRSLDSVRQQVLNRVRPLYPGARLDLRLVRLRVFKVYVAGQEATPGVVRATGATRASEIFTGVHALKPESSRRNIELRHRTGKVDRVDLDAFAYLRRDEANPFLEDGDVIVVPPMKTRIYAYGAFGRPGEFEFAPGDRVADLIELAGGILPGTDPASGLLVRFVTPTVLDSIPIDLQAANADRNGQPLQNQDRLFAREITDFEQADNVTLVGELMRPGPYAIREGKDRVSTVLARAGGPTGFAARSRIQIFRGNESSSQRDIEFERLSRLSRSEMTEAEYQAFKTKLATQQAAFVFDYDRLRDSSGEYDVLLKNHDLILVDRETQSVRVAGEVQRPALLAYEPSRNGEDYIRLAGGFTGRSWKSRVRVTRAGSNQSISLSEAKVILPGDFIWVPEKKDVHFWAVLKDVLVVAGSVATVILLFQRSRP